MCNSCTCLLVGITCIRNRNSIIPLCYILYYYHIYINWSVCVVAANFEAEWWSIMLNGIDECASCGCCCMTLVTVANHIIGTKWSRGALHAQSWLKCIIDRTLSMHTYTASYVYIVGIHSPYYIQHRAHLALYIAASHRPIHPHKTAWRHWQISNLTCNILLCKLLLMVIRYILARQMRCKTTSAHCIFICVCIVMTNLYSGLWISF